MRLVLPPRSAWGKQSRCHRQSPIKAANEAGCKQARFLSGVHKGKEWARVPKFGRSLAHQELRRCSRRPDKVTRQDGALPMRQKGKQKWGILPPRSARSTTQQSGERRSNDSVWKVKCLEEVGEERLSARRRVEPQCESHSSQ
jgi:hypothetical protein